MSNNLSQMLREVREDVELLGKDINDFVQVVTRLERNAIKSAGDLLTSMDSVPRDYCLKYLNRDMNNQLGFDSFKGKLTGKKYTGKALAFHVLIGCTKFIEGELKRISPK